MNDTEARQRIARLEEQLVEVRRERDEAHEALDQASRNTAELAAQLTVARRIANLLVNPSKQHLCLCPNCQRKRTALMLDNDWLSAE